jgi:hypothetical protein
VGNKPLRQILNEMRTITYHQPIDLSIPPSISAISLVCKQDTFLLKAELNKVWEDGGDELAPPAYIEQICS